MTNQSVTQVTSSQREPERERRIFTFKATQLIWLLLGVLEAIIALRIVLMLIGANPESPIVAFIYGLTALFLLPFKGLIGSPSSGNHILELASMISMVVYALVAWIVERCVWIIFYRPRSSAVGTIQTKTIDQKTTL